MRITEAITAQRKAVLRPPWKKGDPSPNPSGHPKGQPNIKTRLEKYGKLKTPQGTLKELIGTFPEIVKDGLTVDDATWLNVRLMAMKGDSWAVNFIAERTEGHVKEVFEIEDSPVQYITIGGKEIIF